MRFPHCAWAIPVEFTVNAYPGRTFTGRVERINPAADPTTRQVRIYVAIPNTGGRLVSGLFADGRVATDARSAVVAPRNALDVRGLRPTAVRLKNGRAERVEVELGLEDEATERVEIRSGLVCRRHAARRSGVRRDAGVAGQRQACW